MRDHHDLLGIRPERFDQNIAALARHDHHAARCGEDRLHHCALRRGRLVDHSVESGHQRHAQGRDQRKQVAARFAAENAELVLQANHIEAFIVDEAGGGAVVCGPVRTDAAAHLRGIGMGAARVTHGNDRGFGHIGQRADRKLEIRGERGDATAARQGIANKGDAERAHAGLHLGPQPAHGAPRRAEVAEDNRNCPGLFPAAGQSEGVSAICPCGQLRSSGWA